MGRLDLGVTGLLGPGLIFHLPRHHLLVLLACSGTTAMGGICSSGRLSGRLAADRLGRLMGYLLGASLAWTGCQRGTGDLTGVMGSGTGMGRLRAAGTEGHHMGPQRA